MRYLIVCKNIEPFYTNWFDYSNFWNPDVMSCVFDLDTAMHTTDGLNWTETNIDHL